MNCQYCNKTFSNLGNLNYHQKTAKFCLKSRDDNSLKLAKSYMCEFCNTDFLRKSNLATHHLSCKEKIIHSFKLEIQCLKEDSNILLNEKTNLQNQIYYLTHKNKEYLEKIKELEK